MRRSAVLRTVVPRRPYADLTRILDRGREEQHVEELLADQVLRQTRRCRDSVRTKAFIEV